MPKFYCQVIALFISILPLFSLSTVTFAQGTSLGVATYYDIVDESVEDGSIVSATSKGYFLSSKEYDSAMVGVVTKKPAISLGSVDDDEKKYPVIASGNILVRVNTKNGEIKTGDYITTSGVAGVGMKATKSGFVIGAANEDFNSSNPEEVGKISVSVGVHYLTVATDSKSSIGGNLKDVFTLSAIAATEQPSVVFKYVVAAFVIILSIIFGFLIFGKTATKGIEALGRNPMAGKSIQLGIALNVFLTLTIIVAGVLLAYFVIRL